MARNLLPDLIRIVDDDPSVCASLTFILQIAGFDVVSYNSADQFLEQATDLRSRVRPAGRQNAGQKRPGVVL